MEPNPAKTIGKPEKPSSQPRCLGLGLYGGHASSG